jgi:ribonuclease HI
VIEVDILGMHATLFTDGGSRGNPGPAGIGYVLTPDTGAQILHGEYIGETTNNQAEYQALLAGLKRAHGAGIENLECFLDSELVVKQVRGEYKVKNEELKPLVAEVRHIAKNFAAISFDHVRREKNALADTLVNEALDNAV